MEMVFFSYSLYACRTFTVNRDWITWLLRAAWWSGAIYEMWIMDRCRSNLSLNARLRGFSWFRKADFLPFSCRSTDYKPSHAFCMNSILRLVVTFYRESRDLRTKLVIFTDEKEKKKPEIVPLFFIKFWKHNHFLQSNYWNKTSLDTHTRNWGMVTL